MIGAGDLAAAHEAADELERTAARFDTELVAATAAQARGEIELVDGDAYAALAALRRALGLWQERKRPIRRRARASRSRSPAARSATRTAPRSSSTRRARHSSGSRPRPISRTSTRCARARSFRLPRRAAGSRRASSGAQARRDGPHEPADRRRASLEREDRRSPRQQHLREARRAVARGRDGVRVSSSAALSRGRASRSRRVEPRARSRVGRPPTRPRRSFG